jgi:hypothetical protein
LLHGIWWTPDEHARPAAVVPVPVWTLPTGPELLVTPPEDPLELAPDPAADPVAPEARPDEEDPADPEPEDPEPDEDRPLTAEGLLADEEEPLPAATLPLPGRLGALLPLPLTTGKMARDSAPNKPQTYNSAYLRKW